MKALLATALLICLACELNAQGFGGGNFRQFLVNSMRQKLMKKYCHLCRDMSPTCSPEVCSSRNAMLCRKTCKKCQTCDELESPQGGASGGADAGQGGDQSGGPDASQIQGGVAGFAGGQSLSQPKSGALGATYPASEGAQASCTNGCVDRKGMLACAIMNRKIKGLCNGPLGQYMCTKTCGKCPPCANSVSSSQLGGAEQSGNTAPASAQISQYPTGGGQQPQQYSLSETKRNFQLPPAGGPRLGGTAPVSTKMDPAETPSPRKECTLNCINAKSSCGVWARKGYCNPNGPFPDVNSVCKQSCKSCVNCILPPPATNYEMRSMLAQTPGFPK